MGKAAKKLKSYNDAALEAADGFSKFAFNHWNQLARGNPEAQNLSELIASATNLALSIELYLKTLLYLHGPEIRSTHNLWDLYEDLPQEAKKSIEEEYDKFRIGQCADQNYGSCQLNLLRGDHADEEAEKLIWDNATPISSTFDLKSVLIRAANSFLDWRYFHELGKPNEVISLKYEYLYLAVFGRTVRNHILKRDRELKTESA